MVRFLYRCGIPWYSEYTTDVTRFGHLNMLKFAREKGCSWHTKTSIGAAKYSDMEFLQYLHTNGCPWHPDTFEEFILGEKPTIEVFQFLHENGCPWDKRCSQGIILKVKDISFLKYLNESGLPHDNNLLALASNMRWFDGVKYIIESEMKCERPSNLWSVIATVKFNCHDFEILKYLKNTGMEWGSRQSLDDLSALGVITRVEKFDDNFEVFQWAIESGCPFDEIYHTLHILTKLFDFRLDAMKYLLGKNCPGVEFCYEYALKNQQVEIVQLLYKGYNFKQKSLFDIAFKKWFKDPSNQQTRDILAYLQRQGCPQNNTFDGDDE